jgi:TM2 domain-containing membrane protein YozV
MAGQEDWISSLHRERTTSEKNWIVVLVLSVFFGWADADRFYVRRNAPGVTKLFRCGGIFIWWIVDVILPLSGRWLMGMAEFFASQSKLLSRADFEAGY